MARGKDIIAQKEAYEKSMERVLAGAYLKKESALTDAEIESAKDAVRATGVVQHLYKGDLERALEDVPEAGGTAYEHFDGMDVYGAANDTTIEYSVDEDYDVPVKSIGGWHSYDTESLISAIMTQEGNPQVEKLNDSLRDADGDIDADIDKTVAKIEELNKSDKDFDLEVDTDYIGFGYIGPYAGSHNFAASDGFEFINLTGSGCLIRIGSGYASVSDQDWVYYDEGDGLDQVLMAIDPDTAYETADIFGEHSGSGDLNKVSQELSWLAQLKGVLDDELEDVSDDFRDAIATADVKYREEQGQQRIPFPEEKEEMRKNLTNLV